MAKLVVHEVNIAHLRLLELAKLADQAFPFYCWVERVAKRVTDSSQNLHGILMSASIETIKEIMRECYNDTSTNKPLLFDGIGRVYNHNKACFFFFAWIIRDAPQQKLAPLIAKMKKNDHVRGNVAEIDALAALIYEYRDSVKSFEWLAIREIMIDRLEGSRRSIAGHVQEAVLRTGLAVAFQNYYAINLNYGKYTKINIADKQIKIGMHTVDLSVEMENEVSGEKSHLYIPVKSRETEGGGHSYIFTRDVIAAVRDIKEIEPDSHILLVIIAESWSQDEIEGIKSMIDGVFHFNINPNEFQGIDEQSQVDFNKYIRGILDE